MILLKWNVVICLGKTLVTKKQLTYQSGSGKWLQRREFGGKRNHKSSMTVVVVTQLYSCQNSIICRIKINCVHITLQLRCGVLFHSFTVLGTRTLPLTDTHSVKEEFSRLPTRQRRRANIFKALEPKAVKIICTTPMILPIIFRSCAPWNSYTEAQTPRTLEIFWDMAFEEVTAWKWGH